MNLQLISSIALFAAVNATGVLLPLQAQEESANEADPVATGEVIPYVCYDRAGNAVFTTIKPEETVGWEMGCREVQYQSVEPESPPFVYFNCYDVNGAIAFSTVDADVAENSGLFCRDIGARLTRPIPLRPVYYECYNTDGSLAFTTSYPQHTYGWKPGCRELQHQDAVVAQTEAPQTVFECLDVEGNVAFMTFDSQEVRRWKLGCREVQ